jgi:hypothetical protein
MAREPWAELEAALDEIGIRPLVAVIPECRDPSMQLAPANPQFWDQVRSWQAKGWAIALHGLHHLYHPDPPGHRSLIPFRSQGEFVGLSLEQQSEILRRSWQRFTVEGVKPRYFIAPSHSFDITTLKALRNETDIEFISDGLSFRGFRRHGFSWIPQQLWRFRPMPFGIWTVCIHPNMMTLDGIYDMVTELRRYAKQIIAPDKITGIRPHGLADVVFEGCYRAAFGLKGLCSRARRAQLG